MNHDVTEIKKHPATFGMALTSNAANADLVKLLFDLIDDCFDLTLVIARADDKDVGDDELIADIDSHDVLG